MSSPELSLPGYRAYEYLLILTPPEDLLNKIMVVKKEFSQKYKTEVAHKSKPHITLVSFVNLGINEERIVNKIESITQGLAPFKVELRDFGSFPSHTIYLNVVTKLPIKAVVQSLKEAQGLMKLNKENKPHFIDEPHITICRKLKPWQYESGWLEYSNTPFTGRFIADSMLLIKRDVDGGKYYPVREFVFKSMPVIATTQGDLFC